MGMCVTTMQLCVPEQLEGCRVYASSLSHRMCCCSASCTISRDVDRLGCVCVPQRAATP